MQDSIVSGTVQVSETVMAYGSTPYVGMTPKKNGGHIESAQMTRSNLQWRGTVAAVAALALSRLNR